MKVVHLSVQDIKGGAARAAFRLHEALGDQGCDSTMLVAERDSSDPTVIAGPSDRLGYLQRRFRWRQLALPYWQYWPTRPEGYGPFTDERARSGLELVQQLPSADVINLHRIAGFVDYQSFFAGLSSRLPVVWTMHDMNALTGGCAYAYDCLGYMEQCGMCPQLGSKNPLDLSRKIWERKQNVFAKVRPEQLHVVTPSRWLSKAVQSSSLFSRFPVSVIPNGLDTAAFRPSDQGAARATLGIPQQARLILFIATAVNLRRKGLSLLAEALHQLPTNDNLWLVSLGSGQPIISAPVHHLHLGHISGEQNMATVYSAADLFVLPSLQDNLPNTVMEALACGTPVVAFDVGGIPDMVRSGETGLLAPVGDVHALAGAIQGLLADDTLRAQMAVRAREVAVAEYTLKQQAISYLALYEKLIR